MKNLYLVKVGTADSNHEIISDKELAKWEQKVKDALASNKDEALAVPHYVDIIKY